MYDELKKRLRAVVDGGREEKCDGCPYEEDYPCCVACLDTLHKQAADAIEELEKAAKVTRCKDCKHFVLSEYNTFGIHICKKRGGVVGENDYCSRAEEEKADV